jgi:tetratricopeptide (TPR) repeat protein
MTHSGREFFRQPKSQKELDPKNPEYYVRLGIILEQQGQVDKAIGLYKSGMKMNFLWAYTQYGEVLEKQNKLAEILPIYQKAIEDNPKARNLIGLYGMLGRTAAKVGKLKDAEAAFYEVLQLDPSDIYAYFSLGDVLKKQGKTEEALSFYQKAAEIVRPDSLADPGSSFSYSQTGDMLRDRGLFDLAIATYRKAIKLNPNNYAPYAWIGETLKMQGKLDEASVYIRKSILLKPIEKKG